MKLETLCDHFNITINAHDALSDIQATRELVVKLEEIVGKPSQEEQTALW